MTWKPDPRTIRTFGPYEMVSERDGDLTAHLVSFPDGRTVRVLPNDRTSGQKRSRVATDALQALYELWQSSHFSDDGHRVDPVAYLVGCLALACIDFAVFEADQSPGEWWEEWLDANPEHRDVIVEFVRDMGDAGFEVRKGEA